MTVSELVKILQSAPDQEAKIFVCQPRSWVKKQPDLRKTSILTVGIGSSQVYLETGDFT